MFPGLLILQYCNYRNKYCNTFSKVLQYWLHVQYCMWYYNTFRAEILQYLEAILFDTEYTVVTGRQHSCAM